ncbi:hypothetical protein AVEN_136771-1 [Araneus ventricosus]|uniref:Uncharacterized protein n=1 Tax=Araneus ventricosus TaxID=182803 RepID=A0A4Y2WW64_ARAVE|nr:hypothetical protein AVEN_192239-1 [Araneus ventricosus]GBO40066.1 hypothetical protein AVEN_149761-1 [Araneus ventricosus]GBO40169.1 hypothetical protein AVEN_177924-1 [Araneus ventricosus]GBO40292.1 hypothetical protein AVEN_136771-1 [Araneus ventricosus]
MWPPVARRERAGGPWKRGNPERSSDLFRGQSTPARERDEGVRCARFTGAVDQESNKRNSQPLGDGRQPVQFLVAGGHGMTFSASGFQ